MAERRRHALCALLSAGLIGFAALGASPAAAVTVDQLAGEIANAPSADAIFADLATAKIEGMGAVEIAQAFGRAFHQAELNHASDEARATILASFDSYKASAGFDLAVLDAAFTVGIGRTIAAISGGTASAGGYLGPTTAVSTTSDNPSPH